MKRPLVAFAHLAVGLLCVASSCYARADRPQPTAQTPLQTSPSQDRETVEIPGPLRSFLRMAGISQEVQPADVLPLLARNVSIQGYEEGRPTEFLLIVQRYLAYARSVASLADANGTIRITGCDDAQRLARALGYRIEKSCGDPAAFLATAVPERAFLTLDSGFPVTALEQAVQKKSTFTYAFASTRVPVLFHEHDWMAISDLKRKPGENLADVLLHDRSVARLYWAMSKVDSETQVALQHAPGLKTLLPLAPALEFYGSQLRIREGRVLLPGGPDATKKWEELAGANPSSPGPFVRHLLEDDHGWLAAYYDALEHVTPEQQNHLLAGERLKYFYGVYHATEAGVSATRGIFPSNGNLMILFSNVRWEPNGDVYIPGNLGVWKDILMQKTESKMVRDWVRRARSWTSPDQLVATLIALSHFDTEDGPVQIYLMLNEIDRERPALQPLSEATLRSLATRYAELHAWYATFAEFPALDDNSIAQFIAAAERMNGIQDSGLRANALGAFQANIGIWTILARQREIPDSQLNKSWQQTMQPFTDINSSLKLFEATRASLKSVVAAAGGSDVSEDEVVDLLAGPAQQSAAGQQVHQLLATRIRAVLDDQRLVSLDTLFGLFDGLDEMAHGASMRDSLVQLAGSLREFEMPRPILTTSERLAAAPEIYTSRHAELQVRTDLTRAIRQPASPAQLEMARGQLAPFLRDTLVGLNYAYYEPPGAQALHHDPLLVRSHDFSSESVQGFADIWDAPQLMGIGVTAGGGAYLVGSLAGLPYALASAEENFIAPANVQALIWENVVPSLLVDAIEPRWWGVSPAEMHAAALYQRSGEEILKLAAANPQTAQEVIGVLSERLSSKRLETVEDGLRSPESAEALIPRMFPAETFYLAAAFRQKHPSDAASWGAASRELDDLIGKDPSETSVERLSRDFGAPHPALNQSDVCMLANTRPFPAFGGEASRLFGESWDSNILYWARLADEMKYSPAMLNVLVPALTQRMVANIFATDIEDRGALLRALQQTGDEFRKGQIRVHVAGTPAPQQENSGW
ncbi:MAG TPA: hypothetical protein VGS02_14520 [Acidobacteriaceae bacterium]|nr:hypothetical protein [Acidobacteriaceae bacterium]